MKEKSNKRKRVLFYSSLKDIDLFRVTGFYTTDIEILKDLDCEVILSNSFLDFLKFWRYDISFIYFWTKGVIPAMLSKLFFKKVIFTGGIDRLDKNYNKSKLDYTIKKYFFKFCAIFSDANIIVSESDIDNIKLTGFNVNNIVYVPHVVDFHKYKYDGRVKSNIITSVVWMETSEVNVIRKGVDKLLYVFDIFRKSNPDFKLVIIGSIGIGTDYLIKIAKELGILDLIIFTGRIDEKEKISILNDSKYYFQLSLYEGFGISAIEALASGNIVFHSGKGGLAKSISNNGVLVPDIDNYPQAAELFINFNNLYPENSNLLIEKGVGHVENNFAYPVRLEGVKNILLSFFK
jgi:glycosyltransferase involved in cell wall biosynthesis